MARTAWQSVVLWAALALAAAVMVACGQGTTTPPPATGAVPAKAATTANVKLNLGTIADVTGPLATSCGVQTKGWSDYWKYVNAEKGGIKGYQIELTQWDSKYNMDQAMVGYARIKEAGVFLSRSCQSAFEEAIKPRLEEDKISLIASSGTINVVRPPANVFLSLTTNFDKFPWAVDWIKDNWKGTGQPKFGGITTDSAYGRSFITDEALAYAKKQGVDWLGAEFIPMVPTDTTAQLLRMKEKGADFVYGAAADTTVAPLVRDATKLGVRDKMTFVYPDALSENFIAQAGADANGVVGPEVSPIWDVSLPGVKLAAEIQKKYGQKEETGYYLAGLHQALLTEKAIELALEKIGADKLDGNTLRQYGFERMTNFDPMGLTGAIGFTAKDHRGMLSPRLSRIEGGKVVRIPNSAKRVPDIYGFGQ